MGFMALAFINFSETASFSAKKERCEYQHLLSTLSKLSKVQKQRVKDCLSYDGIVVSLHSCQWDRQLLSR
ncbi:hypothetical protein SHPE106448_12905 [Shewanella pealeana]